jgi:N-acetylglucosaminyldiphosphoundecaprenol N-acetyl-beta-D-mannosaminyltransferase
MSDAPTPPADPSPAAPARPASASVLGIPLALTDYDGVLDWMDAAIAARSAEYVCVAATHTVMAAQEDPELRTAVLGSSITVPDGQPLVWALRAYGHPLGDRVYGPDLMEQACARAARTGARIFLYGGRDEQALADLVAQLRERHPGIVIAGTHKPVYRPLSPGEQREVAAIIDAARPDIVWVGLGVPRQELWMATMRPQVEAPVLVGVGAAFDFLSGTVAQAPGWMQRAGLEWLFRLSREPRRLWRRYARYNPRFVAGFAREWWGLRRGRRRAME